MKKTFLFLLLFINYSIFAQELTTKIVNDNLHIVGKTKFKVVLKDSIADIIGIKSIPLMKKLFYSDENSYVLVKFQKIKLKKEESIIIKINNDFIDFNESVGFNTLNGLSEYSTNTNTIKNKGFGKYYLTEEQIRNSLYQYGEKSQISITTTTLSSILTTTITSGLLYNQSRRGGSVIPIIAIGTLGTGISLASFINWVDSYKFVKIYGAYTNSVSLEDLKLK
jgi:hypothetical protein